MRKQKLYTQDEVIAQLKQQQGKRSVRAFAKELQVTAQWLGLVYRQHLSPGDKICESLGLRKVVLYEEIV